jgi:hypothetical protein
LSSPPPPIHHNLSPHYPSLLHIHHPLTSLLYQLYTHQSPEIPDTSTFYYNNRNIPKYPQGPQTPAVPISIPPPTHPFSHPSF